MISKSSTRRGLVKPLARLSLARPPALRPLHLAPPFLLDEPYIPRYAMLSDEEIKTKKRLADEHLRNCNLCPRQCGVNRYETTGFCLIGSNVKVSVIAPHFGEESCIQGNTGAGSVFISSCSLRCVFCQNYEFSHTNKGIEVSPEELAGWFMKLQEAGTHNIDIITPEHVVPQIALAILAARELGLRIPIIYNTSAYDSLASLELMDGLVDIYLPDFKVWSNATAKRMLKADNYVEAAKESIRVMHNQVGDLCFTTDGVAKKGVLVRHLVMPGKVEEGKSIMRWLASEKGCGKDVFVNLMAQYAPRAHVGKPKRIRSGMEDFESNQEPRYAEINRPINVDELGEVKQAAVKAGIWRFEEQPAHGGWAL